MIIAFTNHKGGTGKTTSAINIGRALTNHEKKVLLVDLDPQGNLTYSLGLPEKQLMVSDFISGRASFEEVVCEAFGLNVLPAGISLYKDAKIIEAFPGSVFLLRERLSAIKEKYDYILIDCPPSISIYTVNALNAADGVIIPVVFEILSIQGLDQILNEISDIRKSSNPELDIIGVLGVIVNENRKLSEEVLAYIRDNYKVNIFNNYVRGNVKAAEAPSFGESVIDYAPRSISAKDYISVTEEFMFLVEKQVTPDISF
ncbi:MAG: ParA family protein [Bacteroidia bacterium]